MVYFLQEEVCDVEVVLSEPQDITCEVLHASILFLMYINDLTAAVMILHFCSLGMMSVKLATLSKESESVRKWLIDNKLSIPFG